MIKRELRVNLKSFLIWLSILIIIFLVVFLTYPYIYTDDTMKNLDEMMKVFPPELLKSFNMDISSINTAYGWLKSEGFMFVLIIIGIYSSQLGSNILLKEEKNKTIEYLSFLPITRSKIISNKITVGMLYILLMVLGIGIFNYIGLVLSGDFNTKEYLLLSITPLFIAYPLFFINLFISTSIPRSSKTMGISLGLVFFFYVINVISELSDKVSFMKYFSIYTLADTRGVITRTRIDLLYVIICIVISLMFMSLSYIRYNRKELV